MQASPTMKSCLIQPAMHRGEFLTRLTIWVALCAYAVGAGTLLLARGRPQWVARARCIWTLGCAFFLAHVFCAFSFYHQWSHAAAYRETARQTAEMTGLHWGGGIFLNYAFAAAWLADVLWWWLAPADFVRRSPRISRVWHGFFFFMVFNGTVVFGNGPVRWLGGLICIALAGLWRRRRNAVIASPRL
jgi:hypothetical protein